MYGIDPAEVTRLTGLKAHNAAIAALSAFDIEPMIANASRLTDLRLALIGLDYFSFRCGDPPPLPTPAIVAGGRDLVAYQSYASALTALEAAMEQCKPLHIDCRFFIGPVHANYMVLIHETDFDRYLAWKADLVGLARKHNVEFFDLSTTHPSSSLPFSRTRGHFYDLLHYDAAIGADILPAILRPDRAQMRADLTGRAELSLIDRYATDQQPFVEELKTRLGASR